MKLPSGPVNQKELETSIFIHLLMCAIKLVFTLICEMLKQYWQTKHGLIRSDSTDLANNSWRWWLLEIDRKIVNSMKMISDNCFSFLYLEWFHFQVVCWMG